MSREDEIGGLWAGRLRVGWAQGSEFWLAPAWGKAFLWIGVTTSLHCPFRTAPAAQVCGHVVTAVSPKLLLVVVHRADTHTPKAKFLALHPNTKLMALAPHVANMSRWGMAWGWEPIRV